MSNDAARQACSFFLGRLLAETFRLRIVAFPGRDAGPRKWLNLVEGILETAQGYLDKAALAATSPLDASQLVDDASMLGEVAYNYLNHVTGADSTQIPEQVIGPFQRWVKPLGIKETIFFRAEHLPNYELATLNAQGLKFLNSPSAKLLNAISAIDWPTLRVTVPGQAMGMLPHFAVVAHELGHAIQDAIKPNLLSHQQALIDSHNRIKARLQPLGQAFGSAEILRVQKIIDSWTNELKADAVGYYLVGPAFFFALFGFLELAGRNYGIASTHPPSELRRSALFRRLNSGSPSFTEVFLQKTGLAFDEDINSPHLPTCPPADQLFSELRAKGLDLVDAAICVELVPYAIQISDEIFNATDAHLQKQSPELIYKPAEFSGDLDIHLDPLCEMIPPIEISTATSVTGASLASILNVGWVVLLTRINRLPPTSSNLGDETARRMERLHDLLLKAVELSEARILWTENQ